MNIQFLNMFMYKDDIRARLEMPEYKDLYLAFEYRYRDCGDDIASIARSFFALDDYDRLIQAKAFLKCKIGSYRGEMTMLVCSEFYEIINSIAGGVTSIVYNYYMGKYPLFLDIYSHCKNFPLLGSKVTTGDIVMQMLSRYALLCVHGPIWVMHGRIEEKHTIPNIAMNKVLDIVDKEHSKQSNSSKAEKSGWPFSGDILPVISNGLKSFNFTENTLRKLRLLNINEYNDLHFSDAISVQIIKTIVDIQLYLNNKSRKTIRKIDSADTEVIKGILNSKY